MQIGLYESGVLFAEGLVAQAGGNDEVEEFGWHFGLEEARKVSVQVVPVQEVGYRRAHLGDEIVVPLVRSEDLCLAGHCQPSLRLTCHF